MRPLVVILSGLVLSACSHRTPSPVASAIVESPSTALLIDVPGRGPVGVSAMASLGRIGWLARCDRVARRGRALSATCSTDDAGITERLEPRGRGIEQSWFFARGPSGSGDLEIRVPVSRPRDARSRPADVTYGAATWIDAHGAHTPVVTHRDGDELVLRVAASTLETSAYPAVLDPVVGPAFQPAAPEPIATWQSIDETDMAWNGSAWLVVWNESQPIGPGYYDLFARRYSATGTPIEAVARTVSASWQTERSPAVACSTTSCLVVWTDDSLGVKARRMALDGRWIDDSPIQTMLTGFRVTVASNGAGYLLAASTPSGYSVARVQEDGSLPDAAGVPLPSMRPRDDHLEVAAAGSAYVATWSEYAGAPVVPSGSLVAARIDVSSRLAVGPAVSLSTGQYDNLEGLASAGDHAVVTWTRADSLGTSGPTLRVTSIDATGHAALVDGVETPRTNRVTCDTECILAGSSMPGSLRLARYSSTDVLLDPAGFTTACDMRIPSPQVELGAMGTQLLLLLPAHALSTEGVLVQRIARDGSLLDSAAQNIGAHANAQQAPQLAHGSTTNLVAWWERRSRSGATEIRAARFDNAGTVLSPSPIAVASLPTPTSSLSVAASGDEFAITWTPSATSSSLVRFDASGARLDAVPVNLSSPRPDVVGAPGGFLVVWVESSSAFSNRIRAARLDDGSSMLGTSVVLDSFGYLRTAPSVAASDTAALVAWVGDAAMLEGVRVDLASGAPLDSAPFRIGDSVDSSPLIASDGSSWMVTSGAGSTAVSRRIAADGTMTPPVTSHATSSRFSGSMAFDGQHYVITSGGIASDRTPSIDGYWLDRDTGAALDSRDVVLARLTGAPMEPAPIVRAGPGFLWIADSSFDEGDEYGSLRIHVRSLTVEGTGSNGSACNDNTDCSTRFCIDGVCCDTLCGGGAANDCIACSVSAGAATNGTCAPLPSTHVCRDAAGPCDAVEMCDGAAAACPADARLPSGTVCRGVNGECDAEDRCDGYGTYCMDYGVGFGVVCRPAVGPCDMEERCLPGLSRCPDDRIMPAGIICEAGANACEADAYCDGATTTCGVHRSLADGTACSLDETCSTNPVCRGGVCVPGAAVCDDGDACTSDRCDGASGCVHEAIATCCRRDADCDDHRACSIDRCAAGTCLHDEGACRATDGGDLGDAGSIGDAQVDAVSLADGSDAGPDGAGSPDAGTGTSPGCGCRVGESAKARPPVDWIGMLAIGCIVAARVRRRRTSLSTPS